MIRKQLENFYSTYDELRVRMQYNEILTTRKKGIWSKLSLVFKVRYKDGTFAARIAGEGIAKERVLIITGHYFENYSKNHNCVWTKNKMKVTRFFHEGAGLLRNFGIKIVLDIDPKECEKIVRMLVNRTKSEEMDAFKPLCENFSMLEKYDWGTYVKKVVQDEKERAEKEHIQAVTSMDLPMDWENVFAESPVVQGVFAQSIPDGLVMSVVNLGRVDIEYIAQITNESCKNVIEALQGAIYQNPDTWNECFYKGWETAEEYLSGRVRQKLRRAQSANEKYKGYFAQNVRALSNVLPDFVPLDEIYVTLGSPWVPTDVIDKFIEQLFGKLPSWQVNAYTEENYAVKHDELTGTWDVPYKWRYSNVAVNNTYGTRYMNGMEILERSLNLKCAVVYKTISTTTTKSGVKKVIDKDASVVVQEKQQEIIKEFQQWVHRNKEISARLEEIFDEKYGSNVVRHFDGSFLTFPNMSEDEVLFDYQKNAVARILFSPNTLLAHDVGSGKTYIMAAAGMELKRMGISKKNLYVVPNNIVGQWKDMFLKLYPEAKILCVDPKSFTKDKRERVLEAIRDEDFDAVIMAYSCFSLIPVSEAFHLDKLNEELKALEEQIAQPKSSTSGLRRRANVIRKKIDELEYQISLGEIYGSRFKLYFQDLGITTLFVDEAHNFKNLALDSQIENVYGLSKTGSAKCKDMLDKIEWVQRENGGRGVVLATGTPITNSLTDIYVMQRYLQSGELALLDLQSFDSWVGMFAEHRTEFEIDVDTTQYRMATRFSKFHNIPELANILSSVADFHVVDKESGIPAFDGYEDVVVEKTVAFGEYLKEISKRASAVRKGSVNRVEDNMLKITTDGRKAALDMRLVDKASSFIWQSKAAQCADNVFRIYKETEKDKLTQLIFCDISTPKADFNMYDEIKSILAGMGVCEDEIEFIHNAETEGERRKLFTKVQKGEIRILMGSTFKLGIGVNVQEKLVALHHLDVPWRPSDMIQREGRILRQGNTNEKVYIYRYITKGSFDAYSWQLLENKQRMITAILSGCANERDCQDVDDTVLNYAEIKALAIGNEMIKKRVEVANELARWRLLQLQYVRAHQYMEIELLKLPKKLEMKEAELLAMVCDMEHYAKVKREYTIDERRNLREIIYKALNENILMDEEREICTYQEFKVVLPSNMISERMFVYLCAEGKYLVEMGNVQAGILQRIDNFLENFDRRIEKQKGEIDVLKKRGADMKLEMEKADYTDKIEKLERELKEIDKNLGVGEDE